MCWCAWSVLKTVLISAGCFWLLTLQCSWAHVRVEGSYRPLQLIVAHPLAEQVHHSPAVQLSHLRLGLQQLWRRSSWKWIYLEEESHKTRTVFSLSHRRSGIHNWLTLFTCVQAWYRIPQYIPSEQLYSPLQGRHSLRSLATAVDSRRWRPIIEEERSFIPCFSVSPFIPH